MKEIFARRSIRSYTNQPVESEKIQSLVRAAMAAPSAKNQQPWEFLIVTEPMTLKKLADTSPYTSFVANAPVAIVMLANVSNLKAPTFCTQDMSAATQNILLEATSQGLGTCWMGVHTNPSAETHIRNLFDLPENIQAFALVSVGYPDREYRDRPEKNKPRKIHFEKYENRPESDSM